MFPDHLDTDPATVLSPAGFDADWAEALESDDPERAWRAFVATLRAGETRTAPETDYLALRRGWHGTEPGAISRMDPVDLLEHRYRGVYGVEHHFEEGLDWFANPTRDDDVEFTDEWQWQFNRHYQWIVLADAYRETGEDRYAEAFEDELLSWVEQCPRPADAGSRAPSAWRPIEAGIRAGWVWPYAFETFRHADAVSDDALWLFVCAFREHGRHLFQYPETDNHKAFTTNGLAHVGAMFPEFHAALPWLSTAIDRAVAAFGRQFYPDGFQIELAPSYGVVAAEQLYSAVAVARARFDEQHFSSAAGVPRRSAARLPHGHDERVEAIVNAYATLATPTGQCPPLHNSPPIDVRAMYEELGGGDQPWRATGVTHLPWGGYGVLRESGRYAVLDAGPFGQRHQHEDTLQVLAFADDEWLLVDPGKPRYDDSPIRHHVEAAPGHNVVLCDGESHEVDPRVLVADEPLPMAVATGDAIDVTAATRTFETVEGETRFEHERLLCALDVGWLVLDRVVASDESAHRFEWLWHTPDTGSVDGSGATLDAGAQNYRIEPRSTEEWTGEVVAGQRDPCRGWTFSDGEPTPLPVLRVETSPTAEPVETLTLLTAGDAQLSDTSLGGDVASAAVSTAADPIEVLFERDDDGVRRVEYRGDQREETLRLDAHRYPPAPR
jgi:hypothetical protein